MTTRSIAQLLVAACILYSTVAIGENTLYLKISELKAFDTHIDVYFENGEQHLCLGDLKTRFLVKPEQKVHISFLLSAFAAGKLVSLGYDCGTDGYPWVYGVRTK